MFSLRQRQTSIGWPTRLLYFKPLFTSRPLILHWAKQLTGRAQIPGAGKSSAGSWMCSSPGGAQPPPLPAAVSSVPAPFWPRADSCAAPSSHLSWVFTCSSSSAELSSFLWFIQAQTSKLISTASPAGPLLLPRAGWLPSVLATPAVPPQGLSSVPPAPRRTPASQLSHSVL